ncbi:hypothetical protein [Aureimonas glaciei]|uniref:Uncharacterized protein n=1 Tax=Aureimonas glaciei TaxID=1776957 RepID=A0A916XU84_9HYPH|nr:hypothetical protein [Aureimonas glaciei]GGD11883.1 hypothetical protein GCM10011335_13570 [Aureimonas glaciei]
MPHTPTPIIETQQFPSAGTLAHDLGQDLMFAYCEEKNREYFIARAGEKLVRIGHVLGFVFSRAKPFSGELAIQKMDAAMFDAGKQSLADIAVRAAERDFWKDRATIAECHAADLEAEVLSLRKRGRVAA